MNIPKEKTRSNEPLFWSLFGAGGIWSAFFTPVVIFIVCFLLPLHIIDPATAYGKMLVFCQSFFGRVFLFLSLVLPVWCGMHRIYHGSKDMKIHCLAMKWFCYSFAGMVSVIALFLTVAL